MEDLKKVYFFNQLKTINDNFEKLEEAIEGIEVTQIEPAAPVTIFTGTTNIPAVPGSFADVAAVQTYLASAIPVIESRIDAVESKINLLITGFRASGAIQS